MRALLIVTFTLLTGCASQGEFYAGVGAGYKAHADFNLEAENGGGRNPTAHFALGHEWTYSKYSAARCEYNHWSHWRDGGPFNEKPETHKDEAVCWYVRSFGHWSK